MNRNYTSKYTDKKVTAAQRLSEIMCERQAKEDLPYQFWRSNKWKRKFQEQIVAANAILKLYEPKQVFDALQSYRGQRIYSLNAPHLHDIIQSEAEKKSERILESEDNTQKKPRQQFTQKSKISRLS